MTVNTNIAPDAVSDILNNARFQGSMESIAKVTAFIDKYFIIFISLVAFFIISAALLRNVIAGAYAAFPKFWDMVAEAKADVREGKMFGGKSPSALNQILAFFIPDLKTMSDFHDNTIEPRDYFIRAIPQMIVVVMIGIVIYNGYYRDAVAKVGTFGSEIISRVLLNVDPVETIDKIFMTAGRPDFTYANVNTDQAKLITELSEKAYGLVLTLHTDITSSAHKHDLAYNLESWIAEFVNNEIEGGYDRSKYKYSFQVTKSNGAPDLSKLSETNNELTKTFGTSRSIKSDLATETKQQQDVDWHVKIIFRSTEIPEKPASSGTLSDVAMNVPAYSAGADTTTLTFSAGIQHLRAGATGFTVGGHKATISGNTIVIQGKLDPSIPHAVKGLGYHDEKAGRTHTIKNLTLKSGSGITLSSGGSTWDYGKSVLPDSEPKEEGKN